MIYAKEENHQLKYPNPLEFDGIPNWQTHDAVLRDKKYMPLVGTPEKREGYIAIPATWHIVEQSETRTELRQVSEFSTEMEDVDVTYDTSYIQVDSYDYVAIEPVEHVATLDEYKATLNAYLKEVLDARGYTEYDPSSYYNSVVERWAQDARDWIEFRDNVLVYALGIFNQYEDDGEPPCTLEEFDAALRQMKCVWTYND